MANNLLHIVLLSILMGACEANHDEDVKLKLKGIVVSEESYNSEDEYEIIYANIDYLNSLFQEYIYPGEASDDALRSYYVDYYLSQVNNGGFSQFVYNSGWGEDTVRYVREGLREMDAHQNLELFNQSASILDKLGPKRIEEYLESEYFGTNEERDILNSFDDKFYDLQEAENLASLNSKWLKQNDELEVLNRAEYEERIASIAKSVPDRGFREKKALEAEPRYMKLIRGLCEEAGHALDQVTAGDPTNEYKGVQILAWHFITDFGHHYMIEYNDEAIMFNGNSGEIITKISAGPNYGG